MFSLSVPSQTAFPVLFPTFLHSSLPSFHHWGPTVLFDVSLLSIHICLGQWLSDCDAGSLYEMSLGKTQSLSLSLDLLVHSLHSHVKALKGWKSKKHCCKLFCEGGRTYPHAAQLLPHGHVPEELLWDRDTLFLTGTVSDSLLKWLLCVFFI